MRRGGTFSLVCYIIYFLGGIGAAIYHYLEAQTAENWEPLGHAIAMLLFAAVAAIGLLALILKLIHMATGWGFFGFLCILFDIAVFVAAIYIFVINITSYDVTAVLSLIAAAVISVISVISNIVSSVRG